MFSLTDSCPGTQKREGPGTRRPGPWAQWPPTLRSLRLLVRVACTLTPPSRMRRTAHGPLPAQLPRTRVSTSLLLCSLIQRKSISIWIGSCLSHSANAAGCEGPFPLGAPGMPLPRPVSLLLPRLRGRTQTFREKFVKREQQASGETVHVSHALKRQQQHPPASVQVWAASWGLGPLPGMFWEHRFPAAS